MDKQAMFLASEISVLEDLLAGTPEENVIERMSFEARLKSVKEALDEVLGALDD